MYSYLQCKVEEIVVQSHQSAEIEYNTIVNFCVQSREEHLPSVNAEIL